MELFKIIENNDRIIENFRSGTRSGTRYIKSGSGFKRAGSSRSYTKPIKSSGSSRRPSSRRPYRRKPSSRRPYRRKPYSRRPYSRRPYRSHYSNYSNSYYRHPYYNQYYYGYPYYYNDPYYNSTVTTPIVEKVIITNTKEEPSPSPSPTYIPISSPNISSVPINQIINPINIGILASGMFIIFIIILLLLKN